MFLYRINVADFSKIGQSSTELLLNSGKPSISIIKSILDTYFLIFHNLCNPASNPIWEKNPGYTSVVWTDFGVPKKVIKYLGRLAKHTCELGIQIKAITTA